ncbi:MAG: FHA domain-containing protein [Rhizobacter sp.]|nr:FHA domain-containing protein [Bacteriovorax sp.]
MAANVRITTELKNPSEMGMHFRLLCMTGPNKGKVYYLIGKRAVIGRGETADIQIVDTKISREHAELSFADKAYTITDLGASNGIIVSDSKVKQKKLSDGEKIVIGQTVFKYNVIEVTQSNEMVIAEANPDSAMAKDIKKGLKVKVPVKASKGEEEFKVEKVDVKGNNRTRNIVFGIIAVAMVFIMFGSDDKPAASKTPGTERKPGEEIFSETMTVKPSKDDSEVKKKLDALVQSGRREFSEGNYFRAMEDFRLALLLSPNNGQASFYQSKAKQRLDEEITANFEKGAQEQDAKKFQAAIVSFCSVAQLIKEYPDDERYKNAMVKLSAIESALGMEKGEIKCFEEKSTNPGN